MKVTLREHGVGEEMLKEGRYMTGLCEGVLIAYRSLLFTFSLLRFYFLHCIGRIPY